jgi:hypothetical protein
MLRVVQIGLGPLGQKVVQFASGRKGVRIVAAVDPAPDKAGKDLGLLCGLPRLGLRVAPTLASALKGRQADVAILTTVSGLQALEAQIADIARAGLDIVSTCEELSFPWDKAPGLSRRIDRVCRKHGVACVGTGVNPGFLMDYLPVVLSSACQDVRRITVTRIQDASRRRIPFQKKIGAGLTPARFRAAVAAGTLRHVGLVESMQMIARAFHWKLSRTTESLVPVIASRRITSGYAPIAKGLACGVEQIGRGFIGKKEILHLHFRAAVGEAASHDTVEIDGTPSIRSHIPGGVNGDIATCAITINACRSIMAVSPGLKTMLDLPVPAFFAEV